MHGEAWNDRITSRITRFPLLERVMFMFKVILPAIIAVGLVVVGPVSGVFAQKGGGGRGGSGGGHAAPSGARASTTGATHSAGVHPGGAHPGNVNSGNFHSGS